MKPTTNDRDSIVTRGSGNVFADIGVTEPELAFRKSQIAAQIGKLIRAKGWTQVLAAESAGVDQPKISLIVRGRLRDFTVDRLLSILFRIGGDVQFTFVDPPSPARPTKLKKNRPRS